MGILDRLKPLPRWKHADPAIRLEAVRELEDPVELAALAETDPDARIRRAAGARVIDPAVLGRIAASDADAELRDRAADRLLVFACKSDQGGAEAGDSDAAIAVRALTDPKRLSTVAKSDAPDAVRAEALSRITDQRALGSIARHAKRESTAALALSQVSDRQELVEIALRSHHRDVALGAFDRVVAPEADLALLRSIEARAEQKAVSRRARSLALDIEQAEAAERASIEDRRRREAGLCDAVEQLADSADVTMARAEAARLSEAFSALTPADPAIVERFTRGMAAVEAAIARREREAEEVANRERQRREAVATGDALCARVETLDGEDVPEQLVVIEEEWRSLLSAVGSGPEADRLADRFTKAVAACRKRHEMGAMLADVRVQLEALVVEAEALLSTDVPHAAAEGRWTALNREARGLATSLAAASRPADDAMSRLDAVAETMAGRERARQEAADAAVEKARQQAVGQIQRLAERARRAAEADTITLREGERLMRDISTGLDLASGAPASREIEEAVARLRGFQEAVAPRVRELREMDEWRRFANAQRQEQLIAMAEAIVQSLKTDEEAGKASDLAATAKALRELHTKWHEVAEAPRNAAQRLWDRFRTATDFIRGRCEGYFAKLREERESSVQRKTAIVVEAEQLAASSDWIKTAARFQELQNAWKDSGPVSRESGHELAQRFRAACNTFFARRREDLTDRKKVWTDNLAKKESLCERAEVLAESTTWDESAAEMKRLQAEWKAIGPVRRNKSETIWNRFRAAADHFFERYHHRHEITLATKLAEREALVGELEGLVAGEPSADLAERVQTLRTTWNRSVPIPAAGMKPLADRWQTALAGIVSSAPEAFKGSDLDPAAIVTRMEKIIARVESFLDGVDDTSNDLSQTEQLAARLRSAFASNAMGGRSTDDAKWRSAADAVKDAQAAWQRLGPAASAEARALEQRFRDVCRRVSDYARRHGHQGGGQQARRSDRPTAAAV